MWEKLDSQELPVLLLDNCYYYYNCSTNYCVGYCLPPVDGSFDAVVEVVAGPSPHYMHSARNCPPAGDLVIRSWSVSRVGMPFHHRSSRTSDWTSSMTTDFVPDVEIYSHTAAAAAGDNPMES